MAVRASVELRMSNDNVDDLATLVRDRLAAEVGPIVHQASGILMARRGTTIEEAVAYLYEAPRPVESVSKRSQPAW